MAELIRMPKMTDTMEEGVIASWQVKVGDTVDSGDVVAEIETDKATMELESYSAGTILHVAAEASNTVKINDPLYIIGEKGEDVSALLNGSAGESAPQAKEETTSTPESEPQSSGVSVDLSTIPAKAVRMPLMSDTMTEGGIATWIKNVGDKVEVGDAIAEVETDKATMELEAYEQGVLLFQAVEAGNAVAVNEIVAIIGEEKADFQKILDAEESGPAPAAEETQKTQKEPEVVATPGPVPAAAPMQTPQSNSSSNGRVMASPLAKSIAKEKGIDISMVSGSGPNGRITKKDVESFEPGAQPAAQNLPQVVSVPGQESFTEEPLSQMRKTIARRLAESKFSAPHFYLTMELDMTKAVEARKSINEVAEVKISFNDFVIKAAAVALKKHPKVNSAWMGDRIRYNHHVHVGVAVAVDEGLLVPVIRFADQQPLSTISTQVKELAGKARDKKLQPSEWEGNTFTISNLGMYGIEEFTAIINPPDSCIMAVGGIKDTPVVKDGQIVPGKVMKVTLSCDHRVVDGATGSEFLQTFKSLMEDPVRMLV